MPVFPNEESIERLLWWLIAGTKGGKTRATIIEALREMPRNANQLAADLRLDYKTVRHHLGVLLKNRIISSAGNGYGMTYFVSKELGERYYVLEEIWRKIGKSKKSSAR